MNVQCESQWRVLEYGIQELGAERSRGHGRLGAGSLLMVSAVLWFLVKRGRRAFSDGECFPIFPGGCCSVAHHACRVLCVFFFLIFFFCGFVFALTSGVRRRRFHVFFLCFSPAWTCRRLSSCVFVGDVSLLVQLFPRVCCRFLPEQTWTTRWCRCCSTAFGKLLFVGFSGA